MRTPSNWLAVGRTDKESGRMDLDPRLQWLSDRGTESGGGYDAAGWPANIWVLHTIWESDVPDAAPADECVFGGLTFTASGTLGWPEPEPGANPGQRVTWQELRRRHGLPWPGVQGLPPGYYWLLGTLGPGFLGPAEGSLDSHTLPALMRHLRPRTDELTAYWGGGAVGWMVPSVIISGDPATLRLDRPPGETEPTFTPSNMWPRDRSWLTLTDYDLQATRVSGPVELIEALAADPELETVSWDGPPGA